MALDYAQNNGEEVVTLKLTEVGSEALKIRLYRDPELETETHKAAGAGSVVLPRWLDEGHQQDFRDNQIEIESPSTYG